MRTRFEALVTEKSLHIVTGSGSDRLGDMLMEQVEAPEIRNVCFKVSVKLAEEIDGICALLDISKRTFLEAAALKAVEEAKAIMDAEGVYEALEDNRVEGWSKSPAEA